MKRSGHIRWGEVRVGALIFLSMIVFLWVAFRIPGPRLFAKVHTCRAHFADVQGILAGNPVRMSGVTIGTITGVSFEDFDRTGKVLIVMRVEEDRWKLLHADASASIGTIGLLGDAIVDIHPGTPGAAPLANGAEIPTREIRKITDLGPQVEQAIGSMRAAADEATAMMRKTAGGEGSLGQLFTSRALYDNLNTLSVSGARAATDLNATSASLAVRFARLADNLDSLVTLIRSPSGTTGRVLADPTMYETTKRLVGRLDSLSAALTSPSGGGSAGEMLRDRALYDRTVSSLAQVESLLVQVQKNPGKFFKFSVF